MSKRTTDIVAYLSWVGFLVAYFFGDRENSKFHLNQAISLCLAESVVAIAYRVLGMVFRYGMMRTLLGGVNSFCSFLFLALMIMGIVHAVREEEVPLPIVGKIHLID